MLAKILFFQILANISVVAYVPLFKGTQYRAITNMRKDISDNILADFINAVSSFFRYGIRKKINF